MRRLQLLLVDVLTAGGDQFSKLKARLSKAKIQLEKENPIKTESSLIYFTIVTYTSETKFKTESDE